MKNGIMPIFKHARFVHLAKNEQFPVVLIINGRQQRFTKAAAIELYKELFEYVKEQS